jgi:hypothetical protein
MRDEVEALYQLNLQRVRKLVQVYRDLAGAGPGRRAVETADVLRAAVVFLHASLEEVLRMLLVRRWALTGDAVHFEDIPIVLDPGSRQAKATLAELALHRGKTVDQLVQTSIEAHLERATFNHMGDVKTALARSGLDIDAVGPHGGAVAAMMSRRHQIVHRADRQDLGRAGKKTVASLGVGTVEAWLAAVEALCRGIVAKL